MLKIALVLLVGAVLAATPTRPSVPEIFEGNGELRITKNNNTVSGLGQWAIDQPKGWGVEHYEFPDESIYWEVQRWDLGIGWSALRRNCTSYKLSGTMPTTWAWLKSATFNGTRRIGNTMIDFWAGRSNGIDVEAGFAEINVNRPVYMKRVMDDGSIMEVFFQTFVSAPPQPGWFNKPPMCPSTTKPLFFEDTKQFGCPQWAMYKQCDAAWARQELGHSTDTICSAGCAMSSVAMYLTTRGHTINPSGLNQWLDGHGGYVDGDLIVWGSVNSFGVAFQGIENPSEDVVAAGIAQCHGIIANVRDGSHWVLLTGHPSPGVFTVNDPGFNQGSYAFNTMLRFAVYH